MHGLRVDNLTEDDLPSLRWSGTPLHLVSVRRALARVPSGEVEYLAVRAPDGYPIAKVGIDYTANPGAGTLWQMATTHELRGLGIGTHLVSVAESRIRERGLLVAQVDVEDDNPRAWASTNVSVTGRQVADPPPGTWKMPMATSASTRQNS